MKNTIEKFLVKVLPPIISNLLGVAYGYMMSPKKSYSQYGEDIILRQFFEKSGIKKGFYIDIGSYHPKFISNTHYFHIKGWRGVCVDLDDKKLKWFRFFRGESVETLCSGVCGKDVSSNEKKITFFKHKRLLSELDTIDKKNAEKNKVRLGWDYEEKQVDCIGINQVLEKYIDNKIHLLNIDVEGVDEELILNINFDDYTPAVILFEDNLNFGGSKSVQKRLIDNGYAHLFSSGGSVAYFHKSI